mmetsp:Transcript_7800/g.34405  ORF Transcript_7800/g.34405 Transcript_7800/m.34405 type:complete len:238 (+) Transcript_7800:441-1154(+)
MARLSATSRRSLAAVRGRAEPRTTGPLTPPPRVRTVRPRLRSPRRGGVRVEARKSPTRVTSSRLRCITKSRQMEVRGSRRSPRPRVARFSFPPSRTATLSSMRILSPRLPARASSPFPRATPPWTAQSSRRVRRRRSRLRRRRSRRRRGWTRRTATPTARPPTPPIPPTPRIPRRSPRRRRTPRRRRMTAAARTERSRKPPGRRFESTWRRATWTPPCPSSTPSTKSAASTCRRRRR